MTGHNEKKIENLNVIKIGGSTIDEWGTTLVQIKHLTNRGINLVIVHGGGKTISQWSAKLGIRPEFVRGLRKTDSETLEIAVAILAGLVNVRLVGYLQHMGINAVGICGISSNLITAKILDKDLGLVGDITHCNSEILKLLLEKGYIPIISPLALNSDAISFEKEGILNINADFASAKIASELTARRIIYQTDVNGILDGKGRTIPHMTLKQAIDIHDSGIVAGGMIPKLKSCIDALDGVEYGHIIDSSEDSLIKVFDGKVTGTRISNF